jgi:hypothetical protein
MTSPYDASGNGEQWHTERAICGASELTAVP